MFCRSGLHSKDKVKKWFSICNCIHMCTQISCHQPNDDAQPRMTLRLTSNARPISPRLWFPISIASCKSHLPVSQKLRHEFIKIHSVSHWKNSQVSAQKMETSIRVICQKLQELTYDDWQRSCSSIGWFQFHFRHGILALCFSRFLLSSFRAIWGIKDKN